MKKSPRKRNTQDATLINIRTLKRRVSMLEIRMDQLQNLVKVKRTA